MDLKKYIELYLLEIIKTSISSYINCNKNYGFSLKSLLIESLDNLAFKCYLKINLIFSAKKEKEILVICTGDLDNILRTFRVDEIKKKENILLTYNLDRSFVPILNKIQLDRVAQEFLSKYLPQSLQGNPINIAELLENMNLKLEYRRLSRNQSFVGLICFKDDKDFYLDSEPNSKKGLKKGTIYIDIEVTKKYAGVYTINFAIIHECIHWYIHRKFFAFMDIAGKNNTFNLLSMTENINWMEYQANEIASRVLLPKSIIINDMVEIINNYNSNNPNLTLIEKNIRNISEKAKISVEAVRIRLLKLGLKVNGFFEYVDGKYLKSYIFKRTLKPGESYSISLENYFYLLRNNLQFSKIISSNNYIFVNNHLCLKNKKYVQVKKGKYALTSYALCHIDECCILFLYEINKKFEYIYDSRYILCKSLPKKQNIKIKDFETIEEIKITPEKFSKYYNRIYQLLDSVPYNFRKRLRYYRECIGLTREQLEEKSYISAQTIKEIETNNKRGYSVETIISLCIGMQLPPEFSFELIKMSGYNIENNLTKENCIYCFILRNLYNMSIDDINEFLKSNKVNELTKVKL